MFVVGAAEEGVQSLYQGGDIDGVVGDRESIGEG